MGKIERLIVVGVVSLIVIILAVTFTPEEIQGGEPKRETPEIVAGLDEETGTRPVHHDENRPRDEDLTVRAEPRAKKPNALLNTGVTLKKKESIQLPEDSILVTAEGLEHSALETFKLYEGKAGDTFAGLAKRFYGDENLEWMLRQYNEGQERVVPGKVLYVHVYAVEGTPEPEVIETESAGGETYTVLEGESLWTIAKKVYGAGSKWQRIHEANLDVIPKAHDVKPGIRLTIPR